MNNLFFKNIILDKCFFINNINIKDLKNINLFIGDVEYLDFILNSYKNKNTIQYYYNIRIIKHIENLYCTTNFIPIINEIINNIKNNPNKQYFITSNEEKFINQYKNFYKENENLLTFYKLHYENNSIINIKLKI